MSSNRLAVTLAIACALVLTGCGSDPPAPGSVRLGLGVTWAQAPAVCGDFDLGYEFEISGEAFANFPEESSATWRAHFVDMAHPYDPLLSDARVPDLNADPNLSFDLTVPWL